MEHGPPSEKLVLAAYLFLAGYSPATVDISAATGRATSTGIIRAAHGQITDNIVNPAMLDRPGFRAKVARFASTAHAATT
jgi:hypothetical protein